MPMEWDPIKKQYVFKPVANPLGTQRPNQAANKYDSAVSTLGAGANLYQTATGGGSPVSGALSGAGSGFWIGNAIAPGIGGLVGAGAGALIGGIGAGISGGQEEADKQAEIAFRNRQQAEEEKNNEFTRNATTRKMNMSGFDALAAERTNALNSFRGQMFKRDLARAISGGK
jgi:hypothetical protein